MSMSGAEQYNMEDMPMEVMCDDLFDQIDDLLDFPNYYYEDNHFEIVDGAEKATPADTAIIGAGTPPHTCKQERSVGADNDNPDKVLQFDHEIGIAADLEWVSNFMDDTNETFSLPTSVKKEVMDRTPSPNSVLKCGGGSAVSSSSSSSSFSSYNSSGGLDFNADGCQPNPIISAVPARARSKRPRPSTSSDHRRPRVIVRSQSSLEQEFIGESITPPAAERKITIKIRNPQYTEITTAEKMSCNSNSTTVRKCLHCEITKTPQWRAGPMGPKSLCNACGVRYKSGRLFPEYRPAASPTFVPSVHSNSHKKVVEMRIQKPTQGMASRGGCDLLNYIRRRD